MVIWPIEKTKKSNLFRLRPSRIQAMRKANSLDNEADLLRSGYLPNTTLFRFNITKKKRTTISCKANLIKNLS